MNEVQVEVVRLGYNLAMGVLWFSEEDAALISLGDVVQLPEGRFLIQGVERSPGEPLRIHVSPLPPAKD